MSVAAHSPLEGEPPTSVQGGSRIEDGGSIQRSGFASTSILRPRSSILGPARLVASILLAATFALTGCGGSGDNGDATGTGDGDDGETRRTVNRKSCSDLLESSLATLQPDQYQVGDTSSVVTLLGNWQSECLTSQMEATRDAMVGERTRSRLDAETLARVESDTFTERDADHVRTSLFLRQVAVAAAGDAETDLARVTNVFRFVVRNVQRVEEDAPLAGVGAFETFLFGEGSARDRAWIVAALLRQLRIDAVVVRPAADEDGWQEGRWLLGVLLGKDVHLYDPRLGLPVPPPDDDRSTPFPARPATLAEVRGEGELLARLDLPDNAYPLADADLGEVRVDVVLNSSSLAPRLVGLQGILGGRRNVLIVDSLDDPESRLGRRNVVDRVAEAVDGWAPEDVGIWAYPETCLERSIDELNADARTEVLEQREVLLGVLRDGRRTLLQGRLQHLRGRHHEGPNGAGAIEAYTAVRDVSGVVVTEIVDRASRDAQFWMTLCQLERGGGRSAETALQAYVSAPWNGRFERSALLAMATGRAQRGSPRTAIAKLDAIETPGPDAALVAYLKHRWSDGAPGNPPETSATETPATDQPDDPQEDGERETADPPEPDSSTDGDEES